MPDDDDGRTRAEVRHSRWPGWIWAVPLAALLIVGWLVIRHLAERGPEVTVTFKAAEGVRAGETQVTFKGLAVGMVEDVALARDLSHVTLTLRLRSDVGSALRAGTRFWIAGASFNPTDPASIKAIIAGPTIRMDPGPGPPTRTFVGMERPVQVPSAAAGMRIVLHAQGIGPLSPGSLVHFHGLDVGKVESERLTGDGKTFEIVVFIRAPFETLVHTGSLFWKDDGVEVSTGSGGIRAQISSLPALISGAIAFDTPAQPQAGPPAGEGANFTLYAGKDAALAAPVGPRVPFLVRFEGAVGGLSKGAAVEFKGFRIGEVTGVALDYDPRSGRLRTPVSIEIEPDRLGLSPAGGGAVVDAMERLVRRGLRAQLERSPPLVGGQKVVLGFVSGAPAATLVRNGGGAPEIPSAASAGMGDIAAQAGAVLTKIDRLPIDRISADVERTAAQVSRLVVSPQVRDSLTHLDRSLANLDHITRQARGQVGPLIASLRRTADTAQQAVATADAVLGGPGREQDRNLARALEELSGAARALRSLADYLDRHPEALIEGRNGGGR